MKAWIWGRNPVFETLRASKRRSYQLRLADGVKTEGRIVDILRLADEKNIEVSRVPRDSLTGLSSTHQGIAQAISPRLINHTTDNGHQAQHNWQQW